MSILVIVPLLIVGSVTGQDFDRNNVGVSFSPYTKLWENGGIPYWNGYSLEDLKIMLRLVSQKFTSISTYGMGVAASYHPMFRNTEYNNGQPWDQCDSNCIVARAAAQVNRDQGQKLISVNQGVNQLPDPLLQREIDNAFSAAEDANSIFAETVWGITFTNEYIVDQGTGQRVLTMLRDNKDKAHTRGLKIGTRSHICGEIYNPGGLQGLFNDITRESDYIMCNLYPAQKDVNGGIPAAVKAVGDYYFYLREGFRAVNPNIDVIIGETGWPSEGHSFNDSPNSIQNLKDYWVQMGQWASQNGVKVQLFEAIDEPWKNDENNEDPNNPGGRYGAEAHYGWWKRLSNADPNSYVEK